MHGGTILKAGLEDTKIRIHFSVIKTASFYFKPMTVISFMKNEF